jgi:hypothetical protein
VRWRFQKLRLRGYSWWLPVRSHSDQPLEQQCCWPLCQYLALADLRVRWRFQKPRLLGCWWWLPVRLRCLDLLLAP